MGNSEQDQRFTGWSNAKDPPFSGTLRLRAREKSTRPSMERSRTRRRFNFWRKCIHSTKWCGRNANGTWSGACGNDRATGKSKQTKGRGRKRRRKRKRRISQSNRKNKQTRRRNPKRKRSLLASDLPHQRDLPRNPPTNPKCRNSCHPASLRNYPAGMLVGSAVTTTAGRSGTQIIARSMSLSNGATLSKQKQRSGRGISPPKVDCITTRTKDRMEKIS